jgi:hypothetical protein
MGLGGVIPPKPQSQTSTSQNIDNENIRPKINFSQITQEPLKYKQEGTKANATNNSNISAINGASGASTGADDLSTLEISTASSSGKTDKKPQRRKICFNDSVSVAHIPMRSEYSDRVRSRMWSNRYEIHENATRNAIEFQAEGWDWRTVTEDEGMFVCTSSGELIHPVHCQQ